MKSIISVLIPVYNAEKTIERALDSLLNQTKQNFEVIIINDGSFDKTQAILEDYQKKSNIFKIYKQNNQGISKTRQTLVEKANNPYLLFCDADDYLNLNAIEIISNIIVRNNPDLLIFGYQLVKKNMTRSVFKRELNEGLYSKENCEKHHIHGLTDLYWSVLWNKCYKKELIIANPLIEFQNYIEDVIFNVEYMNRCQSIYVIEKSIYNYVQIGDSLTRGKKSDSPEKIGDAFSAFIYLYKVLEETYPKSINEINSYIYKMLLELCERAKKIDDKDTFIVITKSNLFCNAKNKLGRKCYEVKIKRNVKQVINFIKRILIK